MGCANFCTSCTVKPCLTNFSELTDALGSSNSVGDAVVLGGMNSSMSRLLGLALLESMSGVGWLR